MMSERYFGKIVCVVLLFAFPMSMMGADLNSAMIVGSGAFAVNGAVAPSRLAVLAGDRISTQQDAAVALTSQGNSVVISANSSVVFHGSEIQLDSGTAQVQTDRRMTVRAEAFSVSPANMTGEYRVTRSSGAVVVAALHGAVAVSNGTATRIVNEGSTASLQDTSAPDSQRPPAATRSATSHVSTAVAVAAGAAAAAAAAAIAVATSGAPASSSNPF